MRALLTVLFILAFVGTGFAQEDPPGPCDAFVDEDLALCYQWQDAEKEKAELLKIQQDWNNSAANIRLNHYNTQIAKWETKKVEVVAKGLDKLADNIQERIDKLIRLRDEYDRIGDPENPSQRDEAAKLGPKISALSQLIGQIKEQLGIEE